MARSTGISETTVARTVYGSGVVIRDYDKTKSVAAQKSNVLDITKGGTEFMVKQELVYPEFDGALGKIAGTEELKSDTATGKATFATIDLDTLLEALPGAEAVMVGNVATITRTRSPLLTDHPTNIAFVGDAKAADGSIGFILDLPLAQGDMTMKLVDGFAELALEFEAHYSAATPSTRPWTILWPSDSVVS